MEPTRILVIQLRRIGDVILTTPALAALRRRWPGARIDFLVEPPGAEALRGNPHLDEILVYDASGLSGIVSWLFKIRTRRYDMVIDYLGNPRSALLTALSGAAVKAGPAHVAHRWAYGTRLKQSETVQYGATEKITVLSSLGVAHEGTDDLPKLYLINTPARPENLVGLVPASRKVTRRWPASSYARLGKMIRDAYGSQLLVFWGPGEKALADEVANGIGEGASITEETKSLEAAARLMSRCRLIVSNCNGPKHMAVALGVPTLTIHGSSDPRSWNPPHPRHLTVRRDELFCIGCGLNRCPYDLECMSQLSPERVFQEARRLLDAPAEVGS